MVARLLPSESSSLAEVSSKVGISVTTQERWRAEGLANTVDDQPRRWRPAARLETVIATADLDETARSVWCREHGVFSTALVAWKGRMSPVGPASTGYCAHGQMNRHGRAKPPRRSPPPATHIASCPGEVWYWDVTFQPATERWRWFYLYAILDFYSSKIVSFEVHDTDSADHAAHLVQRTALAEGDHAMAENRCCSETTVPHLRPLRSWLCCVGSASNRLTHVPVSAMTTPTPRPCSEGPNTGRTSRSKTSRTWIPPATGPRGLSMDTTMNTGTAASNT